MTTDMLEQLQVHQCIMFYTRILLGLLFIATQHYSLVDTQSTIHNTSA